jgi:hypothetical protein
MNSMNHRYRTTMTMQRLSRNTPRFKLTPILALLVSAASLLSGCADIPAFQQKAARTASHPKATAVLERDAAPPRETASRPKDRERERERDCDCSPAKESAALREGIRLYNDGDFDGAIKRLSARDLSSAPPTTRVAALKYLAFSYCVTSRPAQCRQSFDKALRLDPGFDLAPGEQGHPLWGPVFVKAKLAARPR